MDTQNGQLINTLVANTAIDYDKLAAIMANAMGGVTVSVDGRQFGKIVRKGAVGAI